MCGCFLWSGQHHVRKGAGRTPAPVAPTTCSAVLLTLSGAWKQVQSFTQRRICSRWHMIRILRPICWKPLYLVSYTRWCLIIPTKISSVWDHKFLNQGSKVSFVLTSGPYMWNIQNSILKIDKCLVLWVRASWRVEKNKDKHISMCTVTSRYVVLHPERNVSLLHYARNGLLILVQRYKHHFLVKFQ